MQLGNEQSTVSLSTLVSTALGSFGSRFVFPAVLSAPQVVSACCRLTPTK
jgi:hypothetical protein